MPEGLISSPAPSAKSSRKNGVARNREFDCFGIHLNSLADRRENLHSFRRALGIIRPPAPSLHMVPAAVFDQCGNPRLLQVAGMEAAALLRSETLWPAVRRLRRRSARWRADRGRSHQAGTDPSAFTTEAHQPANPVRRLQSRQRQPGPDRLAASLIWRIRRNGGPGSMRGRSAHRAFTVPAIR